MSTFHFTIYKVTPHVRGRYCRLTKTVHIFGLAYYLIELSALIRIKFTTPYMHNQTQYALALFNFFDFLSVMLMIWYNTIGPFLAFSKVFKNCSWVQFVCLWSNSRKNNQIATNLIHSNVVYYGMFDIKMKCAVFSVFLQSHSKEFRNINGYG